MSTDQVQTPTVFLTGATGFIGSGIRHALARARVPTRLMVRSVLAEKRLTATGQTAVIGDVTSKRTLLGALQGTATVVHAASYVGADPDLQRLVNVEGTRKLVEAATRADARVVYMSTFGVLGSNYAAGASEATATAAPRSALSRSRYEAEQIVLAHGGNVIRPALVYGVGDRWVMPTLVRLTLALDAWIEDGLPLVSAIDNETLGELTVAVTLRPPSGEIFNAAMAHPVRVRQLVEPLFRGLTIPSPTRSINTISASDELIRLDIDASKIAMIARDTWIDAAKIWAFTSHAKPQSQVHYPKPLLNWYRTRMATKQATGESRS